LATQSLYAAHFTTAAHNFPIKTVRFTLESLFFYSDIDSKPVAYRISWDRRPAMIICHCTAISDHDIHAAIDWMRASDPQTIITPGKIYRALGKQAECGGCMPLFLDTMRANAKVVVPAQLQNLRTAISPESNYEGRPQSHRISQQGT
jgi:bacterioferritin-associated ferredoxin